ncbi:hypothetical protein G3O06_07775 [Burkholderia sp. Ac-20345]|uniref:hypothetical protein n=1 Tax=Burkholderia sp. Ac-20345 TaxID=2703891 RepID=UPI00197BB860|nr:hypothetical protein [Burkholderia sp. Ac-20345]MBN3777449.1 hypothetical protein [Burkholderia sp. Ac-20345]
MGYYGIADAAGDFSRTRNSDLMSGVDAYDKMTDAFMKGYQVPERMLASDANALGNSIKFDTLNQGYDDMVQAGTNTAATNAEQTGVNLHKLAADDSIQTLRAQAAQQGITNPVDVANYVSNNLAPEQVAANPYLQNAATDYRRIAGLQQTNLGAALGGNLGSSLATDGLGAAGYGIDATLDDSGNIVYTDAAGNRSLPFSRGGAVPSAAAFGGNVDPSAQYGLHLEDMAAQSARTNAQLAQRDRYDQMRWGQTGVGGPNQKVILGQMESVRKAANDAFKRGDKVAGAQLSQQYNALRVQLEGGAAAGAPSAGTSGMNAITGASPGGATTGTIANPMQPAASAMPSSPYLPAAAAVPHAAPAVPAQPSVQAPAVVNAAPVAQPAAARPMTPAAAQPAAAAPAVDHQKAFDAATARVNSLMAGLRQMDADAGPRTVYGPLNPPKGYAEAREQLVGLLGQAQGELDRSKQALSVARWQAEDQRARAEQAAAATAKGAAVQQLLDRYTKGY